MIALASAMLQLANAFIRLAAAVTRHAEAIEVMNEGDRRSVIWTHQTPEDDSDNAR